MKNLKKTGISLLGVFILLLVIPIFIPTQSYLKQAEVSASEMFNVPISLKKARLALLPSPRVYISGIQIGKNVDATAADMVITPTLMSLFSDQKMIDVTLENVVLKQSALVVYDSYTKHNEQDNTPPRMILRNIKIKDLHLHLTDTVLPDSNVMITLKDNQLDQAVISSVDQKIKLTLNPKDNAHSVSLAVKDLQLPIHSQLMINTGQAEMTLKDNHLKVTSYKMHLYQGDVSGQATLSWAKDWQLEGDLTVQHLALNKPSRLINPTTYLSGRLDGSGTFAAKAKTVGQLTKTLLASFTFNVKDGVLHGLDLTKAASLLVKQRNIGGETQFDQCSGKLTISGKQYQLSELDIRSGLLAANGYVKVSPNNNLDGLIEVELKKSAGLVAVPLNISGKVDHPVVLPSKAALAGAAVGTAILGPGVGTSLGIKASKGLNKLKESLFGDDKE
jgi:uncharacterized protein involved in outer membrane biogenesis